MYNKYDLEIVSPENGKKYKKHNVDGLKTIGVYENEPFKIHFRNNTGRKVQVRVSVDGTDILTGEEAHTRTDGRMWVVNGYGTLELKAWPEDNEGGAEFLFGQTADSVAANTHGNLAGKGLIAVAVFEEQPVYRWLSDFDGRVRTMERRLAWWTSSSTKETVGSSNSTFGTLSSAPVADFYSIQDGPAVLNSIQDGPAVGAGDYQSQKITKAAGIVNPTFAETLTIKYEWWTSLRSKLRNKPVDKTAFPGDQKNINLGMTPRLETPSGRIKRIRRKSVEGTRLRPEEKYVEYQRFG